MGKIYEATLRQAIVHAKQELKNVELSYSALTDNQTEFADDLLEWASIKNKVLKVYEDAARQKLNKGE